MGKRRLKDRVKEAGEAFETARAAAVEESLEAARPDDELFFVDTEASQRPAPRTRAEKRRRFFDDRPSSTIMPSVHLVKAVQRAMKTIQQGPSSSAAPTATQKGKDKQQQNKGVYDIWDAEPSSKPGKKQKQQGNNEEEEYVDKQTLEARRRKPNTVARRHPNKQAVPLVRRPMPGQSYHPAADAHQAALQKALEVEERREQYVEQLRKPLGGMSEETKALLLSDSSSDEEEGEEQEKEEEEGAGRAHIAKRRGKLTKAERNKIRRRKLAEHVAKRAAEAKAVVKHAGRAREVAKALAKAEARKRQEKAIQRKQQQKGKGKGKQKGEKKPKDLPAPERVVLPGDKNPTKARSLPVPLSDELSGSLRLLKAKGSLASEALEGLQRRGEYEPVGDKKRARPKQRVKYMERFRGE